MDTNFHQWDLSPLNLKADEIINPLKVISDFFSDDSLDGHLQRLNQWRDVVLEDDFYRDAKGSPCGLLYFYKLNLRLVEAASLILKILPIDNKIMHAAEKYPTEISQFLSGVKEAESLELYAVLSSFFVDYSLPQYREQLFEWLEYGLSKKGADEFITSKNIIGVYENLKNLYSASWLICQHIPHGLYLHHTASSIPEKVTNDVTLYQLHNAICESTVEPVSKVVAMIKDKVSSVQIIFYLGGLTGIFRTLYFLVLTTDDELQHGHSLASTIEESCRGIISVHAIVLHGSKLYNGIVHKNRFFQQALKSPLVYLSGERFLPSPPASKTSIRRKNTTFDWNRWFMQGKDFLFGAKFYISHQSFSAALFSMHQCAECLLTAIVKAVLDYNIGGHNLTNLLQMTMMFTNDIAVLFDLENKEKMMQFDVLKHAYINVRYKDNYEPDIKYIDTLYQDMNELVIVVEKVYNKYLMMNSI